jgi:hypothetical protein
MSDKAFEITQECNRQAENCLYTSTSLFIWLRILRWAKFAFIVVPLVLGGLGAWKLLTTSNVASVQVLAAVCSFLAGLLPTIYAALKLDDSVDAVACSGTSFKNLQDHFRQLALIHSHDPIEQYQGLFEGAMTKMDEARATALTPPEWVFRMAQKKVKSGDYAFDHDRKRRREQSAPANPRSSAR